jgi:dGTPase
MRNQDHDDTAARRGSDTSQLSEGMAASVNAYGSHETGIRLAHADTDGRLGVVRRRIDRSRREELLASVLAPAASRPSGAGRRAVEEQPDNLRLCFEVDLDRIRATAAFRRLAGKCQVFMAPSNDMIRTRLTHSAEVAQVAVTVSEALGLCTPLVEAISFGHDCGHGPGGHSAEDAFTPYLPNGFDHAIHGSDVVLASLNLCEETLDGIRSHSWKLAAPSTPEGEVVSWADRIAYCAHDLNDAIRAGLFDIREIPAVVRDAAGVTQGQQLRFFVDAMIRTAETTGRIGMDQQSAEVLDALRMFNFERIYLRPASMRQAERVENLLTGLVDHFIDAPMSIPDVSSGLIDRPRSGSQEAATAAVNYVASMTDRYAMNLALDLLDWRTEDLPRSI